MISKSKTYLEILEERKKVLLIHAKITIKTINTNQEKLKELEKELQDNAKEEKQFKAYLKSIE